MHLLISHTFNFIFYLYFLAMACTMQAEGSLVPLTKQDTSQPASKASLTIGGYIDSYWAYNFNQPRDQLLPYFVNSAVHNELNINLSFIDIRYNTEKFRLALTPGFGSYIDANYTTEKGIAKHLVEARIGFNVLKKKGIWVDLGVFNSPYTNESAISRDHLMYTRSFAPEYVPYYIAGGKLSIPVNSKLNLYLYLLNGWQQITDLNKNKSLGTQLEWKHTDKGILTWNTYAGNEQSVLSPDHRMRYFTDIYYIYNTEGKFSFTTCAYVGLQERRDNLNQKTMSSWWQANLIGRYRMTKCISLSGRVEYFDDPSGVQIKSLESKQGFNSFSTGLCLNLALSEHALFRMEGRYFFSRKEVYLNRDNAPAHQMNWFVSNMTVWF